MKPKLHVVLGLSLCFTVCFSGEYNYGDVLGKSILFYEAQRSGKLPSNNRIPWRGDTFLNDQGEFGEDLSGGYFDAGDFIKFGFPMAWSMTMLAWGMVDSIGGYEAAGELSNGLATLKWGTDYLIKSHVAPSRFYCQVGDPQKDHNSWGRPEDWPKDDVRPNLCLTTKTPGSDVSGEAAAALAASSIVFRKHNAQYSDTLLAHAQQLYCFANSFRGNYSDSFPQYYTSTGYGDELAWAAAWLYRATNRDCHKHDIDRFWNEFSLNHRPVNASWDSKVAQVQVLMAKIDGSSKYMNAARSFCDWVVNEAPRTPKGLVFLYSWGVFSCAANVAYICIQAGSAGINPAVYNGFAKKQIDYMLGDAGRSFVVGFGHNPPKRPHHKASSCPSPPETCDWKDFTKPDPNTHVLTGALVGGPDANDSFVDNREDYVHNEVALDYNAGFQSALAALHMMKLDGKI